MTLKKKIFLFITFITIVLLLIISSFRIITLNNKYPSYTEIITDMKEVTTINDLTVSISNFEKYDYKTFYNKQSLENSDATEDNKNTYDSLIVSLNIENKSNRVKTISFEKFLIERNGWCSYIDVEKFYLLNNWTKSCSISLCSGDTVNVILPYTYRSDDNIESDVFGGMDGYKLNYYMCYPKKYSIQCKI